MSKGICGLCLEEKELIVDEATGVKICKECKQLIEDSEPDPDEAYHQGDR